MRIMWYGVPPWLPTGYASQADLWARRMRDAGHDVVIAAHAGLHGEDRDWDGIPVLANSPHTFYEARIINLRIRQFQPDVVIVLCDHRHIPQPEVFRQVPTVAMIAGDCDRLSAGDAMFLQESRAHPWAMSKHMVKLLEDAGYDAPYVPHAIDTTRWQPPGDRAAVRAELGLEPGTFAVGIVARNIDPHRKAIPEQIAAFARFRKRHPSSRLFLHTLQYEAGSTAIPPVVASLGLKSDAVSITDQDGMYLEMFPQELLAKMYGAMDVVMNCSRGEGFGLTAVEAQACGTPVILADNTTGPELQGPGWLVPCDHDHWVAVHEAWQAKPLAKQMTEILAAAVGQAGKRRQAAREFALQYDVESVWPLFEKALSDVPVG